MLPHEREKFEDFQNGYGKPWMPFQWALCTLRKARKYGSISSDYLLDKCCEVREMGKGRSGRGLP